MVSLLKVLLETLRSFQREKTYNKFTLFNKARKTHCQIN